MRYTFKERDPTQDCQWRRWFAWYPICLCDGVTWVWLEWVERKAYPDYRGNFFFKYQHIEKQ